MRAAQLDQNGVVINYAEVGGFDGVQFVDPLDSVIGSTWNGSAFVPPVVPLPTIPQYEAAVQQMLDAKAQQFGYDGMRSACTYAGDPDPTFNDQGTKFKTWRSQCWRQCYNILGEVQGGTLAQPTIPQLLAMLPASPL